MPSFVPVNVRGVEGVEPSGIVYWAVTWCWVIQFAFSVIGIVIVTALVDPEMVNVPVHLEKTYCVVPEGTIVGITLN